MTPTVQRRLAAVACCTVTGEPDGTHLSVEEWSPRWQEWLTSMALCGQSAEQGALPVGTTVTCIGCEGWRVTLARAPRDNGEHVCRPGTGLYFCPTAGEVESSCHGGFDVCCAHPELHQPVDERTTPNNPPASNNTAGEQR